ncbi:hypothetical protein ACPV36_19540 [Photobacterium damselae]|uniref:hypothetical protein n=1 Tax=Photobacterium damselae TaxID=38293 RepID=UPI004068D8E5
MPVLIPLFKIVAGAMGVAGIWGVAEVAKNTSEAVKETNKVVKNSGAFMDRTIALTAIGGAIYLGGKLLK